MTSSARCVKRSTAARKICQQKQLCQTDMPRKPKKGEPDIYERCRRILKMPDLPAKEMDEMREHLCLLAQTVCEHLRGKKFY